mmetsp:Transcript_19212/g.34186  ORF Transcript_19212/g.34186 Transcript_19212/m.34186 type:complete len:572 (+) Transcript_19212:165-1880(+)|eukprot:CAMPEP_0184546826 /NCGR_PEP_ID=MMETSP0199_2-20130426/5183_1 /TAXON_ID=1112570 /ORGANISM="Thraustochytrium sp., Strain LLF1b" /LENGTH=571 /DNA_ID=CAMNT_0026941259 /DNA_START=41 /DNA_END=1756 /DNA_ORIENTATION=+
MRTLQLALAATALVLAQAGRSDNYEVWASDQSNSVTGLESRGVAGSYIWIWKSNKIEKQISKGRDAKPIGCGRGYAGRVGPCDLNEVFPGNLREVDGNSARTGNKLRDLNGFGRLHGMLPDRFGKYVTANIFAPTGGYVGVIDTKTKEAVALFRVTGTNVGGGTDVRSVHMSLWSKDGSQIQVANLHGKLLERIDVVRNRKGKIVDLIFNKAASLGLGKGMQVTAPATVFRGRNQHGNKLLGKVRGEYSPDAFSDTIRDTQVCKEDGCEEGALVGRPNNVIICPVPSEAGLSYVTMGGGGLLIVNTFATPMEIVGSYGNTKINGAGCGGGQTGDTMWLNAGVSAGGAGATWSTFTMYNLNDSDYLTAQPEDTPLPTIVYDDEGNTATGGHQDGESANTSGQLPGSSTRRDAHGLAVTIDNKYVHNVDRIQNKIEVFSAEDKVWVGTYDLTSIDGQGDGIGACDAKSVVDDAGLPRNDPAPDLLESTPDGKYLMVAFRGPVPVSVTHSAQGSCPGVGIVELTNDGRSGKLVSVLRTTNTVDTAPVSAPGGHPYTGAERSDIHGATVVYRQSP